MWEQYILSYLKIFAMQLMVFFNVLGNVSLYEWGYKVTKINLIIVILLCLSWIITQLARLFHIPPDLKEAHFF